MIWIKLGSLFMFFGVAFGAFGAHALKNKLSEHYLHVFTTGVLYQLIHALGLFVVAWLTTQSSDPKINLAGIFLSAGIVLFSGSLYVLAVTQIKWFGPITPVGGVSFLIGWAILFFSYYDHIQ